MHWTHRHLLRLALATLVILLTAVTFASAQGGATSTLSGTVVDASGAVIPGADVVVKSDATGTTFTAVSGTNGGFTIPAMPPGTYTVTVTLQGFKTAVLKDVVLNAGLTQSLKATLEVGGLEETVVVGGATEVVQTQSTSVAATMNARQIANLPVPGRAAFDLVAYIPGVASADGSIRGATVNGLPSSAVNITLDGMNIQDNYAKTWDGMFTRVSPRLDAVEEVTVATAAAGADMAGQGGVQVKFVTRAGSNKYSGAGYYYLRRDWMNSNTWFNEHGNVGLDGKPLPKPVLSQYQPGFRVGGPMSVPGLFDARDKAFFFVNYEEVRSPGTNTGTRTIMSPNAQQGIFQYSGGTVNLLSLAAASGQVSRIDPIVGKLLADIRSSTSVGTVNATSDPLTQQFVWQQPTNSKTTFPTLRFDYNITQKHRASFSMTRNHLVSDPDTTNTQQRVYPGFPVHGLQDSMRYTGQFSFRSTLSKSMVNEARYGKTGGATQFSPDLAESMYSNSGVGNMAGYSLAWSNFKAISNPSPSSTNSAREGKTNVFEDTLSLIMGKHAISTGFSYTRASVWQYNDQLAPTITLGTASGVGGLVASDPAEAMFTAANFPGASSTDLFNARALYAVLTGRVSAMGRTARIGEDGSTYEILGASNQYGSMPQYGTFLQDSWRLRQDFTVNAGLRYDVQMPFRSANNSYSMATLDDLFGVTGVGSDFVPGSTVTGLGNLFKPGVLQGQKTTFKQLEKGTKAYNTDWGNVSPSIGAAWTTGANDGFLRMLLGPDRNSVFRAGYNKAYQRGGMSDFTEIFGANPGISIDASRNTANGNLGTLPVLLTGSDLSAPGINLTRVFPMAVPNASSSVFVIDPDIKTPHSNSISIGWQRGLTKSTSIEARFVHTDSHDNWTLNNTIGRRNYNQVNIVENGFLGEFRLAQQNLQANIAAGRGQTFAYTGAPGTVPLPIFLSYFNGSNAASDTTKYTGTNWTSSTYVPSLYPLNPTPQTIANNIRGNAGLLTNGIASGRPSNFWVVNPDVDASNLITNGPSTRYNGVQLVFNRRFANGFLLQSNYAYGKGYQYNFYGFHKGYIETEQNFSNSGNGNATGNIRHSWSTNWVYELPFGRGKAFGRDAGPVLNRIIGNWNFQGVARIQSGRMVDFGNVRLNGMTEKELSKSFKLRLDKGGDPANPYRTLVFVLPQDIIDNTVKAYSVNATGYSAGAPTGRYFSPANGPDCLEIETGAGDCGARSLVVTGPKVMRFDMSLTKQIAVVGSANVEFQWQVFNVFNRVNFNPVTGIGSTADNYRVTGAVDQSRTMQLAFRIQF